MVDIRACGDVIRIGRQGENEYRRVLFPMTDVLVQYPDATFNVLNRRSEDTSSYVVPASQISVEGTDVCWVLKASDLAYDGDGECEVIAYSGNTVAKDKKYTVRVLDALDEGMDPPDPSWDEYLADLSEIADRAETAETGAAENALKAEGYAVGRQNGEPVDQESPYYHGHAAYFAGEAGVSAATAAGSAGDAAGSAAAAGRSAGSAAGSASAAETAQIKAEEAQAAAESARDQITGMTAEATTLDPGESATASYSDGVLSLGIPRGADGQDGEDGADGYSPSAAVSKSGSTATITIMDKTGTTTAEISDGQDGRDGADGYSPSAAVSKSGSTATITITDKTGTTTAEISDGQDGQDGADGYTPQRGTDYWTAEDQAVIISAVEDAVEPEISELKSALDSKAPAIYQTASVDIVSFDDGADGMPLSSCVVQIDPVQSGTGDPSPTNIRPISGWTGCNISRSGVDTSDPTVYAVDWQTASGTVYGGTLDTVTGVLTVTMGYTQYTAAQFSAYSADHGYSNSMSVFGGAPGVWFRNYLNSYGIAGRRAGGVRALCNAFPIACNNTSISSSQNRSAFRVDGTTINSVESFIAAVQTLENNGGGLYIAYELATPVTYQLDPVQITTLFGANNLWADTGAISLTYPADTQTYVDTLVQTATDPDGNVVTVSGSTPSITGESGKRYVCGTVDSISITPPQTGIIDVVFTSGATPTVLTVPNTVRFPAWFDATALDASTVYEINIQDGFGAVMAWT